LLQRLMRHDLAERSVWLERLTTPFVSGT